MQCLQKKEVTWHVQRMTNKRLKEDNEVNTVRKQKEETDCKEDNEVNTAREQKEGPKTMWKRAQHEKLSD